MRKANTGQVQIHLLMIVVDLADAKMRSCYSASMPCRGRAVVWVGPVYRHLIITIRIPGSGGSGALSRRRICCPQPATRNPQPPPRQLSQLPAGYKTRTSLRNGLVLPYHPTHPQPHSQPIRLRHGFHILSSHSAPSNGRGTGTR